MTPDNPFADIIFGVVSSFLGFNFLFRRKKIVGALLESNKVFWGKLGFPSNERMSALSANIMIPFMGAIFLAVGMILLYRVAMHFLK